MYVFFGQEMNHVLCHNQLMIMEDRVQMYSYLRQYNAPMQLIQHLTVCIVRGISKLRLLLCDDRQEYLVL